MFQRRNNREAFAEFDLRSNLVTCRKLRIREAFKERKKRVVKNVCDHDSSQMFQPYEMSELLFSLRHSGGYQTTKPRLREPRYFSKVTL